MGHDHESSYAETIFAPDHWDLVDVIAVVSTGHKKTGSEAGHPSAKTSDLQSARVQGAAQRLATCKNAIANRDFASFAEVVELDSNLMHAVMLTSRPSLMYWMPASIAIMQAVREWRGEGLEVCFTLDAGPNVHCLCTKAAQIEVVRRLQQLEGIVDIRIATIGQGAVVLS
jgi:diphosphomevalonate decarboxylase